MVSRFTPPARALRLLEQWLPMRDDLRDGRRTLVNALGLSATMSAIVDGAGVRISDNDEEATVRMGC